MERGGRNLRNGTALQQAVFLDTRVKAKDTKHYNSGTAITVLLSIIGTQTRSERYLIRESILNCPTSETQDIVKTIRGETGESQDTFRGVMRGKKKDERWRFQGRLPHVSGVRNALEVDKKKTPSAYRSTCRNQQWRDGKKYAKLFLNFRATLDLALTADDSGTRRRSSRQDAHGNLKGKELDSIKGRGLPLGNVSTFARTHSEQTWLSRKNEKRRAQGTIK